jgi:cytochrome c-type biogenesis protein CcmH/NrfG
MVCSMVARTLYGTAFAVGVAVFLGSFAAGFVESWQHGHWFPELAYDELGQARDASALGDVGAAERQLRTYAALQPDKSDGWLRLAQFLQATGDSAEAIVAYERATLGIPAPVVAHQQLAILYARSGNLDAARPHADLVLQNGVALPPDVRAALGL